MSCDQCSIKGVFMGQACFDCGADNIGGNDFCQSAAERRRRLGLGSDPENLDPMGAQNHPLPPMQEVGLKPGAPQVIGLCGLAGSGKTTVASFLEAQGYVRLSFARPLKEALRAILVGAGASFEEALEMTDGALKEVPTDFLAGKTPRHAMQTLGTEWGRDCIDPDFWAVLTARRAAEVVAAGGNVVIDDVRFPNEALALRDIGAAIWSVRRLACLEAQGDHLSEQYITGINGDFNLDNEGDLDALEAAVLAEVLG